MTSPIGRLADSLAGRGDVGRPAERAGRCGWYRRGNKGSCGAHVYTGTVRPGTQSHKLIRGGSERTRPYWSHMASREAKYMPPVRWDGIFLPAVQSGGRAKLPLYSASEMPASRVE